jgi:hypothetical protein
MRFLDVIFVSMAKLLDIFQLSEATTRPVRQLRSFVAAKKIPYLKLGHRTMLFDPAKVEKALLRFEVKAAGQ